MDIVSVILHLKTFWPVVNGRVAGAVEFSASMAGELRPEAFPAAYVMPLGEEAEPNDTSNALYQIVNERIAVAVEFDNSSDRRGQTVTQLYAATRTSLFAALLNWRATDPAHAIRGFEAGGANVLSVDRGRIFYQWEFVLPTLITDADGWQVVAPPLLEIDANTGATDPQPQFRVLLPQPAAPVPPQLRLTGFDELGLTGADGAYLTVPPAA